MVEMLIRMNVLITNLHFCPSNVNGISNIKHRQTCIADERYSDSRKAILFKRIFLIEQVFIHIKKTAVAVATSVNVDNFTVVKQHPGSF